MNDDYIVNNYYVVKILKKNQVQAGEQSSLINKEKFIMLKDFPKSRPNKIIYSPTMTP